MVEQGNLAPEDINAYYNLGIILDRLPRTRARGGVNKSWARTREWMLDWDGPDSIASLIPSHVAFNTVGLTVIFHTLRVSGIKTISALVECNLESFRPKDPWRRRFGPKNLELITAIQAVARVEQRRKSIRGFQIFE